LLLEGGGHIRGGFLQAGLVDEVSGFVQTPMEPAKFSSRKRNAMPT
jgi:riboflavin biosynthesis pyrimidine reductase